MSLPSSLRDGLEVLEQGAFSYARLANQERRAPGGDVGKNRSGFGLAAYKML